MKKYLIGVFILTICLLAFSSHSTDKANLTDEIEKSELLQKSMIWIDSTTPTKQSYVVFRKEFNFEKEIKDSELRIFADSRYIIWINGRYVERGPSRFDRQNPEYDIIEISQYPISGENTIAILVHHYNVSGFTKWHDKSARIMDHMPGLAALLTLSYEDGETSIVTGSNWKASKNTRFRDSNGSYTSIPDNIDARLDEGDWTLSTFDDSDWGNPTLISGNKWGSLVPRSIPLLREKEIVPVTISKTITSNQIEIQNKSLSENLPLKLDEGDQVVIDVGKMVQAYSVLDFDAEDGSELELGYASLFHQNGNVPLQVSFNGKKLNSHYIAKSGFQSYMGGDTYGFRYLVLRVVKGIST
jgi:alpha-L-rhamnosidase